MIRVYIILYKLTIFLQSLLFYSLFLLYILLLDNLNNFCTIKIFHLDFMIKNMRQEIIFDSNILFIFK